MILAFLPLRSFTLSFNTLKLRIWFVFDLYSPYVSLGEGAQTQSLPEDESTRQEDSSYELPAL
jgi:hypothetical protein